MLNLLRYHDELRRFPGTPDFDGTPVQSNGHYNELVTPLIARSGTHPLSAGT